MQLPLFSMKCLGILQSAVSEFVPSAIQWQCFAFIYKSRKGIKVSCMPCPGSNSEVYSEWEVCSWLLLFTWRFVPDNGGHGFLFDATSRHWNHTACRRIALKQVWHMFSSNIGINSLWPSDAIWRQKSGSTLARVMACCLTAPRHYLNQCWLILSTDQWRLSKGNFTTDTPAIIHENQLQFA